MATSEFYIRQTRTAPIIRAVLKDQGGDPIDLSGATVTFRLVAADGTVIVDGGAVTVNDASGGDVQYAWQSGDTDDKGVFSGFFDVAFAGGADDTIPTPGRIRVIIEPRV